MKLPQTAFNKAIGFISASIEQVSGMTKPQKKFVSWLFEKIELNQTFTKIEASDKITNTLKELILFDS